MHRHEKSARSGLAEGELLGRLGRGVSGLGNLNKSTVTVTVTVLTCCYVLDRQTEHSETE